MATNVPEHPEHNEERSHLRNDPLVSPQPEDKGRQGKLIVSVGLTIVVLFLLGIVPRIMTARHSEATASPVQDGRPSVAVVEVQKPEPYSDLSLPGTMDAIDQTAISARASGYVKQWLVDIGDRVKEGQVLAVISTPDLDQQLLQARAELQSEQAAYSQSLAIVTGLRAKLSESLANLSRSRAAFDEAQTVLAKSHADVAHAKDSVVRLQAQVVQAQTGMKLAQVTSQRYNGMLKDGAVDRQSADEQQAAYDTSVANVQAVEAGLSAARDDVQASEQAVHSAESNVKAFASGIQSSLADVQSARANIESGEASVRAAKANIASSRANVEKIADLQSFQRVVAPFAGVITARNIDTGSLVSSSGSGAGSATGSRVAGVTAGGAAAGEGGASSGVGGQSSLYSIAKTDRLRVYINVPQVNVDAIHVGQSAQVQVSALGNKLVHGLVARTANSLDAASRTLVTEVDVDNPDGRLKPGMFVQVRLHVVNPDNVLLIPDSALISNAQGTQVATIDSLNRIHFVPVVVGRDFGKVMEITAGIKPGDVIASNPSDALIDGVTVKRIDASTAPRN